MVSRTISQGENSLRGISRSYGLDPKEVGIWIALYRTYGEGVFSSKQKFSQDFRELIIQDKLKNGLSLTDVCVKYKILHRSSLRSWIRLYKDNRMGTNRKRNAARSASVQEDTKSRIKELEKELLFVKAENAYLKKLQALMLEIKKSGYGSK